MLTALPTHIDPLQLAKKRMRLAGCYPVATLTRLCDELCDTTGEIEFDWQFAYDDANNATIQGHLRATLTLLCQRCLQPMAWSLDSTVRLIVITAYRNEDDVPEGFESLELAESPIYLRDLVEDEALLALPIVARHTQCQHNEYQLATADSTIQAAPTPTDDPFAVLTQLKK